MADKICNSCNDGRPQNVPYIVHESAMARAERSIKRLWITIIVLIAVVFACNAAWLIYESQFEQISYEQDGDGINSVNYGTQGDLNNEPESSN